MQKSIDEFSLFSFVFTWLPFKSSTSSCLSASRFLICRILNFEIEEKQSERSVKIIYLLLANRSIRNDVRLSRPCIQSISLSHRSNTTRLVKWSRLAILTMEFFCKLSNLICSSTCKYGQAKSCFLYVKHKNVGYCLHFEKRKCSPFQNHFARRWLWWRIIRFVTTCKTWIYTLNTEHCVV